MNNNKFDGPSFVNPNHTSHSLGTNIYQHPTYIPSTTQHKLEELKKNTTKKGPKGKINIQYFIIFSKNQNLNSKILSF